MSMPAEHVTPIYDLDMARDFFRMIDRDGSFMRKLSMMCRRVSKGTRRLLPAFYGRPATPPDSNAPGIKYCLFTREALVFSSPSIELMARDASGRISPASVVHGARTIADAQLSYHFSHP